MSKDLSFARFFNPSKSPSGGFDARTGQMYFPIHMKRQGRLVWDSAKKGTYVRAIHGELK